MCVCVWWMFVVVLVCVWVLMWCVCECDDVCVNDVLSDVFCVCVCDFMVCVYGGEVLEGEMVNVRTVLERVARAGYACVEIDV